MASSTATTITTTASAAPSNPVAIQSTPRIPRGDTTATLNFYKPPADGSEPYNYVNDPPPGVPPRNIDEMDTRPVKIHDMRGSEDSFTPSAGLDRDAFALIRDQPPSAEKDFTDDASIAKNYYPELESLLLKHVPGATKVVFFDHTVRRSRPGSEREPVQRVHIDQTAKSAAMRVQRHAENPEDAEKLLQGRYRIINVWRPLNKGPVESFPLAVASSATLENDDVVPVKHIYANGYHGETAGIKYNEGQKWYYVSGMTGDERLLLECFDSEALKEGSAVQGGRVAHTAFHHPDTREDAVGRESIEVRTLVFGP